MKVEQTFDQKNRLIDKHNDLSNALELSWSIDEQNN